jgi:ferric-dicitrate binding protein FerR (iron transport regulator)
LKNTDLEQLFLRYLAGEISHDEVKQLLQQFGIEGNEAQLRSLILRQFESGLDVPKDIRQSWKPILQDTYNAIKEQIDRVDKVREVAEISSGIRRMKWLKYSAAAAIALLITSSVVIFLSRKPPKEPQQTAAVNRQDIAPGGNKAVLTLANGKKVRLNVIRKGIVSIQGNTKIIKLNSGQLMYKQETKGNNLLTGQASGQAGSKQKAIQFNTLSTPRGGQYQLVLSDGTKVWLNAASSIRYPTAFTGDERKVQITGEAYFEVVKNTSMPFEVSVKDMTVKVLGTHFNVMAYKNEPTSKVTLLEGAIIVKEGNKEVLLEPGQQTQIEENGQIKKMQGVDLDGEIAWKNNQFWFNDDNIQTVMRRLSRWYNVEVVIKGDIPQHFAGYIPRNMNVSKVFQALQATTHLTYRIQKDKIIVSP